MITRRIFILAVVSVAKEINAVLFGKTAKPGQFNYQALLKLENDAMSTICGGVIIDEIHIVTAWHCIDEFELTQIEVFVGAIMYSDDPNGSSYKIRAIKLHPDRSCETDTKSCYDIAVLTVMQPIVYSEYVNEIPLPDVDINPGDECVFAGWGVIERTNHISDKLKYGSAKISQPHICSTWYPNRKYYEFCFQLSRGSFTTSAQGDSGGPFVCNDVLTGIILRGASRPMQPVLLINVFQVRDFIVRQQDADICNLAD